jgi:transposase-like protein
MARTITVNAYLPARNLVNDWKWNRGVSDPAYKRKEHFMGFWEHRAVQDKCDLAALKEGAVMDDETPPEEMDRRRLSPRQMLALKAFHSGSSLADAAKAAGVTRQTLHRWRTQYHWFFEAMEVWEEGQMVIARSRLVDMADNAVDALAHAIEDGDARAAMMVLKSLRILRTYGPLKAPHEEMRRAAVLPALNDRLEEPACVAGFQPVVSERQRVEQSAVTLEQAGRLHHNENGKAPQNGTPARETANPAAGDRRPPLRGDGGRRSCDAATPGAAAKIPVAAKTAPAAQHINVTPNPPFERPKPAILAGKAGSAIKNACYSALQEVTGSYEMLPNGAEQNGLPRSHPADDGTVWTH